MVFQVLFYKLKLNQLFASEISFGETLSDSCTFFPDSSTMLLNVDSSQSINVALNSAPPVTENPSVKVTDSPAL